MICGNTQFQWIGRFAALLVLTLGASASQAQVPEGFDEWRDQILKWSDREIPLNGLRMRWRVEDVRKVTPDQIARLEQASANRPHSEEKQQLAMLRSVAEGKAWIESEMWVYDGHWRRNWNFGKGGFFDHVLRPDRSWSLTESSVTVFDKNGENSGLVRFGSERRISESEFRVLLTGGFSTFMSGYSAFRSATPVVTNDRWRIEAPVLEAIDSMSQIDASGRVLGNGRFTIDRCKARIERAGADPIEVEYVSSEWRFDVPGFESGLASEVREVGQAPFPRRFQFIRAEQIDEDQFDEVTRVPGLGGTDPVRGSVSATFQEDYTGGTVVQSSISTDATRTEQTVRALGARVPSWTWNWASFALISGVVVVLIVWRLKNR